MPIICIKHAAFIQSWGVCHGLWTLVAYNPGLYAIIIVAQLGAPRDRLPPSIIILIIIIVTKQAYCYKKRRDRAPLLDVLALLV